jgi:hypothetical protein
VARSYVQGHGGVERIVKLIILATLNHGMPGENNTGPLESYSENMGGVVP